MARTMKKFSAGGAQGRYERRMADIEKDFKKAMARKTGKDAEVAEAKRQQRIADAKDDLAKRTGADRTATRAAERAAEETLTKTRRQGKSLLGTESFMKSPEFASKLASEKTPAAATPEAAKAKPSSFKEAFKDARSRLGAGKTFTFGGKSYTTNLAGEGRKPVQKPAQGSAAKAPAAATPAAAKAPAAATPAAAKAPAAATPAAAKAPAAATPAAKVTGPSTKRGLNPDSIAGRIASGKLFRTSDAFRKSQEAKYGKAKGGSVKKEKTMKYAKGGSTSPRPTPKKPMPKEPITGGSSTVPLTPQRKEFLKELEKRNAKPGMAKGGKATKFGKALVKKSADTMGRAMVKKACGGSMKKYASGGLVAGHKSADGCAIKGKTKGKMLARGGAVKMRGRDSYGGAEFKKGGSC